MGKGSGKMLKNARPVSQGLDPHKQFAYVAAKVATPKNRHAFSGLLE